MIPGSVNRIARCFAIAALCACFGLGLTSTAEAQRKGESRMSGMGHLAQVRMRRITQALRADPRFQARFGDENEGTGAIGEEELDEDGGEDLHVEQDDDFDEDELTGGQAETSLAVDATGQHVVIGFNDTRGFSLNPVSVSGFIYSDDGGLTFTDGGQLPVNTGTSNIGTTILPQVFGDPEIVYLGGSNFVYASIAVNKLGATGTAQTMCVHLSNDYGHTWKGPFIIPACTNPHGLLSGVNARDAADKEFMGRDADTGRVMLSWSNFTATTFAPGGVEISRVYSDDLAAAATALVAPTWSTRLIVGNRAVDGQSSIPRFAGNGSNDAYVVWRTASGFFTVNESVAISHDNGVTFAAPINLRGADFKPMDHVLGNDRTNNSPGFDVDRTGGATNGNMYVVYTDDNSNDGGDIAFQRSTNGGLTWSPASNINARPGSDRAQWFPWVVVDQSTGRIHVFYYDQGIANAGDMSEVSHTYSDNGGVTWFPASPISDRPFHAGYGNDTGQPNIGDYNQAVTLPGEFFGVFASNPQTILFQNGQPAAGMNFPDVKLKRTSTFPVALRLGSATVSDSSGDGIFDPGETLSVLLPLDSYANSAPTYTGVSGALTTSTANVTVLTGASAYADVATLGSSSNATAYKLKLTPSFVPGTSIELSLAVTTAQGPATLLYTIKTGKPVTTSIYNNNFDGGIFTGWATSHGGGANTVAWAITNEATRFNVAPYNTGHGTFFFHQNENDGVGGTGNPTRFERLFSPVWITPADADYVTVDFDVAYNSEDEGGYNVYAYDGFLVRVTDQTPGFTLRSVLAEAFAYDFTTGGVAGYPKHFPRNSSTAYFEDMSAWSGYSGGWKHVHMKLPGMAGKSFQLRFEYAQDSGGTGHDTHPAYPTSGVAMDNLVINSVHLIAAPNSPPVARAGSDQTVECAGDPTNVTLDGSASSDPDGEPITYEWFQGATSLGTTASIVVNPPHNATTTYTLVVTDAHGNTNSDTVDVTIADTTPPVVTLIGPTIAKIFCHGTYSDPGATATDICDGDVTASIVRTGTVGLTIGSYPLTYTATDAAGNHGSKIRTVKVIYDWSGVLDPINQDGSSIFKLNSTIPVKFNLVGDCANDIITAHIYVTKITNNVLGDEMEAVSTSAADTGNTFRKAGSGWIFNLATKGLSTGTWQIRIDLGDGELHTVNVSLK